MEKTAILQTARLNIFAPTFESFANKFKLLSSADVAKFLSNGKPKNETEVAEFLQKNIEHFQKFGFCLFDVFLKNSGEFIGDAGLIYESMNPQNQKIEVGYRLLPNHWNQGYATELADFFIKWGFENFHLKEIFAFCDTENSASSNVMKKCKMTYQGRHFYNGKKECDSYKIIS